jgi:hypothetical protein
MGQYHYLVNLDKREFVHPHKLGDGLKLREHSEQGVMGAMHVLVCAPEARGGGDYPECAGVVGRWHGDRVALVGDYAEDSDLRPEDRASTIQKRCDDGEFADISEPVADYLGQLYGFRLEGDGWRQRVSLDGGESELPKMCPDMVVVVGGSK